MTDQATGQLLVQAQIQVLGGGGTLSDAQGNFTVSLDPGSYSIVAVLLGYETVRVDGISVSGGAATEIAVGMTTAALALAPVSVTVSRGQEASSLSAPAQVSIVTADDISRIASTSTADFLKGLPGVDVSQVGINQSNTVTRGFNNVFSGALLVLTDYRYARVPSIRLNNYNLHPTTPLDIERIEVVLGPAAALYGPNASSGVMHIITSSPIDRPGTSVAISGGNQSMFRGIFRHAMAFSEKAGLKVSGQYFRGNDFEYTDPVEAAAAAANPGSATIGQRDFFSSHYGGEARLDLRPWDDPNDNIIITGGLKTLASSIEPTGIGAGQAKNWTYKSLQARINKSGLFVQAFLNNSSAGDTYMLRTGNPIVDNSVTFATQGQYNFSIGERFSATAGVDYSLVTPKTGGTINGMNEDNDVTKLFGAYVQTTTKLTDQIDFVAAIRRDTHNWLEDAFVSPRLGLVLTPEEGHAFRATYNRSFSTPTSNNLFLDILAGRTMIT
ncbi:MAG: TonB-dependent receptor, partial [Acidobacteria bacterium]|nr:TonB-dependent receptor [Acidobacteriota bacterium]